jgi:hypothetical protein
MAVLDALTRTCKTLRSECDLAYAVVAMRRNRRVKKVWARRWLGLDGVWLLKIRDPTLAVVLGEVQRRGGLGQTGRLALAFREKDVKHATRYSKLKRDRERWAWIQQWMSDALERRP